MKLKNLLLSTALLGIASLTSTINPAYAAGAQSIAIVNYDQLIQASKAYKASESLFMSKFDARKKAIEKKFADLAAEEKNIIALRNKLQVDAGTGKFKPANLKKRDDDLRKRATTYQNKLAAAQKEGASFDKEVTDFQRAELARIENQIKQIVATYAKQQNIDLVLDTRVVIYNSASIDLTKVLIEKVK